MLAPIIGITTAGRTESGHYQLHQTYLSAVRQAGGVPILLAPGEDRCDRLIEHLDGIIFTGGGDIHPECYDGKPHPTIAKMDLERDRFELDLAQRAIQADLAVLGICRGMQVLSIVSGAMLIPHVPETFGNTVSHVEQQQPDDLPTPTRHPVILEPGSVLSSIVDQREIEVVSWHHQAVPTVPPGWQVAAHADDGLIEAVEHMAHPWAIALQWHPELSAPDDPHQQAIFRAFVHAAASVRSTVSS